MKLLKEDILKSIDLAKKLEPTYRLVDHNTDNSVTLWCGDLIFEMTKNDYAYLPSLIDNIVRPKLDSTYDFDSKQFLISMPDDALNSIKDQIKDLMLTWIENTVKSPNPKLSIQYRWFALQELCDETYIIGKYMCSHASDDFYTRRLNNLTENRHEHNILHLLDYLRLRGI
jgi:hypothetical protein